MHSFAACALLTLVTAHVARGALYNRTVLDGINWAWPANNKTNFASARPRIYVYELPAKFRQDDKFVEIAKGSDYSLDVLLPWMVKQSPYVTKNPEEADFFLGMPCLCMCMPITSLLAPCMTCIHTYGNGAHNVTHGGHARMPCASSRFC